MTKGEGIGSCKRITWLIKKPRLMSVGHVSHSVRSSCTKDERKVPTPKVLVLDLGAEKEMSVTSTEKMLEMQ